MIFEIRGIGVESILANVVFMVSIDIFSIMMELPNHSDFINMRRGIFFQAVTILGKRSFFMRFKIRGLTVCQFIG